MRIVEDVDNRVLLIMPDNSAFTCRPLTTAAPARGAASTSPPAGIAKLVRRFAERIGVVQFD